MTRASGLAASAPLHLRVKEAIAQDITDGVFAPGDRLPSERSLCERLKVSRITLRRALKTLDDEGLLESSPNRGWFVAGGPIGEPANVLMSFSEMASGRGLRASADVLSREVRAATIDEAESLAIAPGSPLFELRRLRYLDGTAIAVDQSRIPLSKAPDLPEVDFSTASLYSVLRAQGGEPVRASAVIEAVPADQEHARLLLVTVGTPLLSFSQVTFGSDGQPIELGNVTYRGDRYRFRSNLVARGST
jgi:GntR family transcriptional regulator